VANGNRRFGHLNHFVTSWPPREKFFFLASICHAITDPPVTKIRWWASFGV